MKTKLFTQNSFLVMIMTLVLAFSVQGIADALTFSTSRSGDLETKAPNEQFTIRFSVSLKGNTAIRNSDGDLVTESAALIDSGGYRIDSDGNRLNTAADGTVGSIPIDSSGFKLNSAGSRVTVHIDKDSDGAVDSGETYYTLVEEDGTTETTVDSSRYAVDSSTGARTGTSPLTPSKQFKVSDAVRYHYTSEAIKVDLTGDARIVKVGSHNVNISATDDLEMYERSHASYNTAAEHKKLSGSVTLILEPTGVAGDVVTVKVTDETPATDAPTGGKSNPITFTLYSVIYQSAIVYTTGANGVTTLVGDGVEYAFDNDVRPLGSYFTFATGAEVPVHYSVDGSGTLAIERTYTDGSPTSMKTASRTLSTSSSAPVFIDMKSSTNKVTAWVSGGTSQTVIFIYQGSSPTKYPEIEVQSGDNQTGAPSGRLDDYFEVKVTDGRNRPISGVPVTFTKDDPGTISDEEADGSKFIPVPGTRVYAATPTPASIDAEKPIITVATTTTPAAAATHHVQTDRNGVAKIYYQLSANSGTHTVTATVHATTPTLFTTLTATASSTARARLANLEIVSGNNQRGERGKYLKDDLVVIVRSLAGHRVQDAIIQFRTTTGQLVPAEGTEQPTTLFGQTIALGSTLNPTSGQQIFVETGPDGEAGVSYNVGQVVEARDVIAEIREEAQTSTQYDFAIDRVVFNINGTTSSTREPPRDPPQEPGDTATLTVTPTTITGRPGSTHDITITASQTAQIGNLVAFSVAGGSVSQSSGLGTFTSTLTLPSQDATYTLTVTAGTQRETVTVRVSSTAAPETQTGGRLTLDVPVSGAPNSSQTVRVTITDADGNRVPDVDVTLAITSGGGTFSASRVTTGAAGTAASQLTLGSTPGTNYFVTATAANYPTVEQRISIIGTSRATGDTPASEGEVEAGEANNIEIVGSRRISGTLAEAIRLRASVLDANDNGVRDVAVTFRVFSPGRGTFAGARGSGRAIKVDTDRNGYATVNFTPTRATDAGTITVEAKAAGVSAPVSFIIDIEGDTGSATPGDTTEARTYNRRDEIPISLEGTLTFSGKRTENGMTYTCVGSGECVISYGTVVKGQIQASPEKTTTPGTGDPTPRTTEINPVVHIGAANRPPMLWADSGAIYALVGAEVQEFISGVEGAMNIAIAGNKVYWTEKTGESSGTINAANLDGSGAKELKSIMAVPMGIAVDTAANKVYWTNSRGRIQSLNTDGSGRVENVWQDLSGPMDIAVARGNLYWTQYDAAAGGGKIGIANPTGRGTPKYISTDSDAPLNLVIAGNKVYWTEQTGQSSGTINSANLNGTEAKQLASILAVPRGIAVDTARSKLYWTNSRGRIQSADLNGSKIQNVVDGLGMPGDMVLSNSIKAPTATTTPPKSTTTVSNTYDVDGSGSVDNVDVFLVALAVGTSNAKYDINGDGTVDDKDIALVRDNRDDGAASAPMVVGMKLSADQIGRLQAQIDLLVASSDRSPATLKTLVYLQQLIATARPEKTQLLANYPNPFNPETWIPYELATDTDVRLTIYNAQGVVIRTLQLGHQSAGYYTDRERAAYWDGRNALGEQVASGIYFYQLETDEISSLRKMVILK